MTPQRLPSSGVVYGQNGAVSFSSLNHPIGLTGNALFGMYVGIHEVDGVRSHHVAFANDWLEWQLWIDAENDPLPRKIVINYKNEPGEPQYTAVLRAWNLSPDLPEGLFEFEPPDGATRMEAKNFRLPWARGAEEEK